MKFIVYKVDTFKKGSHVDVGHYAHIDDAIEIVKATLKANRAPAHFSKIIRDEVYESLRVRQEWKLWDYSQLQFTISEVKVD